MLLHYHSTSIFSLSAISLYSITNLALLIKRIVFDVHVDVLYDFDVHSLKSFTFISVKKNLEII